MPDGTQQVFDPDCSQAVNSLSDAQLNDWDLTAISPSLHTLNSSILGHSYLH